MESVAMVLIIHGLFQKKCSFDKLDILYILANGAWYVFGNYCIPEYVAVVGNLFVIVTCAYMYFKFKAGLETTIQAMFTLYMLIFIVELVIWGSSNYFIETYLGDNEWVLLASNCVLVMLTLLVCYFIYKKGKLGKLFYYVFKKNRILGRVIVVTSVLCFASITMVRLRGYMSEAEGALFLIFAALLLCTLVQWKKAMELGEEKDRRIMIQQMCQESYEQLILEVRNRQHEFQNHLAALQGMCHTCQTIEELTELQSRYCEQIFEKNKYNKLLYSCKSPMIGGFLYSKFSKAEEKEIETEYQLAMDLKNDKIEDFELIEMVGILYDNAIDALEQETEKKICVKLTQEEEQCVISVENISPFLSSKEIGTFFQQGFSTKGKGRGLGLAKLQKMVQKYEGRIITQNIEKEGKNWISFEICI
jgi:hypothetical protein